ncbi:RNA polymerase factor sigma-54 [Tepidibacter thalassicus]|uniref:RNA polymerase, sigma 54 subunit, RpoN/SigL n=1 Tax=Tepidibacter thalassicus DSM 15285 TaxID=1123350 RepID=A0A1M5PI15_9FIRM|nr:RNA polymerase factor sigma-54 [Tepidibacter thalassicus]SHH01368.1 RNA polymerase, sigma 54 subunit, RpoN/SigL [Tepidibacter thalassicus DSM 15285]
MKLNLGLELNQSQKLILTKQLKQSLDILNMSMYELEEIINKENEENPIIEVEKKENLDWEKYIEYIRDTKYQEINYSQNKEQNYNIENIIKYNISIYEHLKNQINYYNIDKKSKEIVEYIIDCLDENGYFKGDICEISKKFGISDENVLKNLKIVQSLEPSGVGARSVKECLLIQIKEKQIKSDVIENIIKEDLNLIANKKYKDICKKYKITPEKCRKILEIIKTLEPKPGRKYSFFENNYIIPDVIVEKIGDKYEVYLNDTNIPNIKINKFYQEILKNSQKDDEAKEYIKEKLNSAINLIKNIESRKNTILRISKEIVKHQMDFFEKGNKYLKPLILKDIAIDLGIHESTVSRGINGKYMLTPYGLFELKYFFSGGIDIASTSIKNIIKEIISFEDKKKPYSDSKICSLLKEKNINISRRTVAKYREELGIPSSTKRKKIC